MKGFVPIKEDTCLFAYQHLWQISRDWETISLASDKYLLTYNNPFQSLGSKKTGSLLVSAVTKGNSWVL